MKKDNVLLCDSVVSSIADKYEEQEKIEKIKELEKMIINSMNANIYAKIYKPEYGDYRQYTEKVAKELRRRYDFI